MMRAYSDVYLGDVVENQGKLFDYVANTYPDKDTENKTKHRSSKSLCKYNGCQRIMGIF